MPEETVRLRNRRQQPVELHLPHGVLVLPPAGDALVSPSVLTTPQVSWLLSRRVLSTEVVSNVAAIDVPAPASAVASRAVKPRRAATATRTRRAPKP
jgi:hypothetical protein